MCYVGVVLGGQPASYLSAKRSFKTQYAAMPALHSQLSPDAALTRPTNFTANPTRTCLHPRSLAGNGRRQVTVISGETGCGKTTQVPQYILDDAHAKGKRANVNVS